MKINSNRGYVAIDIAIAVIGIIVFSGLIISLMYNNFLTNAKVKKEAIAAIYLTEVMENIGIATYEKVIEDNIEELKPEELREKGKAKDSYALDIIVEEIKPNENKAEIDIVKKIAVTISYKVGNKTYSNTLERIKVKE